MTKQEVLRKVNLIYQELQEVARNSENPEQFDDLKNMVDELKESLEDNKNTLEMAIEAELKDLKIDIAYGQLPKYAKLFALRARMGPDTKFRMSDLKREVAQIYGVKPSSIDQGWYKALERTPDGAYRKMMRLCDGSNPTLRYMSDYFAKKYSILE